MEKTIDHNIEQLIQETSTCWYYLVRTVNASLESNKALPVKITGWLRILPSLGLNVQTQVDKIRQLSVVFEKEAAKIVKGFKLLVELNNNLENPYSLEVLAQRLNTYQQVQFSYNPTISIDTIGDCSLSMLLKEVFNNLECFKNQEPIQSLAESFEKACLKDACLIGKTAYRSPHKKSNCTNSEHTHNGVLYIVSQPFKGTWIAKIPHLKQSVSKSTRSDVLWAARCIIEHHQSIYA